MLFSFSCSLPQGDLFPSILYLIYYMAFSPFLIYIVPIVWPQLLGHLRQYPICLISVVQGFLHNHCFFPHLPCENFYRLVGPEELGDTEHHRMDIRCYSCTFIVLSFVSWRNEKLYPAFSLFKKICNLLIRILTTSNKCM